MGNAFCYCCSQCQGQNQIPENFMPYDLLKLQSMDDLKVLIDYIDEVLREKEKAKAERKKTTEPSTSTAQAQAKQEETTKPSSSVDSLIKSGRELTEKFSTGLNRHLCKKCLLCALDSRIAKVLAEVKFVPYAGMAFSIIAHLLERAELVKSNQDKCFRLLRYMFALAKHMKDLDIHLDRTKLDDILRFIVKATVICATQMEPKLTNWFCRFICASLDYGDLQDLESQLQERHEDLKFEAIIEILKRTPKVPVPSQGLYPDYAVGIQEAENEVIKLLDLTDPKVRVVVIYGVGGIGKTTLASAVFNHLDLTDHIHCRVDIDQDSKATDLKENQEKILRNLFDENVKLDDWTQGRQILCECFKKATKPVFLFIDNALKLRDLEKLLPMEQFSLPNRSRILLTTRNLNQVRISSIQPFSYKLNALSTAEAKRLLCKHALGDADGSFYPAVDMDGLLQMCEGIPLLLKLIGSHICTEIQRDHHHTEIQSADENQVSVCNKILEHYKTWKQSGIEGGEESECMVDFVHGQLKETSKEAFLDIVFFFRGWERSKVAYIVGDIDLEELEGAALVSTSEEREWWESDEVEVKVHDIVRERGKRLSKGNRITDWDSWEDVRKDEQKLRETKGICLPGNDIHLEAEHVALTSQSLRVLSLGKHPRLNGGCERPFKELRFLDISYKDLLTIQKSKLTKLKFLVVHLVEGQRDSQAQFTINLSQSLLCLEVHEYESSMLETFAESCGNLSSLRRLNMRNCHIFPKSFGNLSSLQELSMWGCSMLETLPDSFGNLSSLQKLVMFECVKLQRLPERFGNLSSLQILDVWDCSMLETLPDSFGSLSSLKKLYMDRCVKLQRLPERFGNLSSLQELSTWGCSMLETLPDSFGNLSSLKELDMCGCGKLQRLPERFGNLSSLQELDMRGCSMLETLPDSFGNLSSLKKLDMNGCVKLQRLPERFGNLSSLQKLEMRGCSMLETLPESLGNLSSLKELDMCGCGKLQRLPERFGNLSSLQILDVWHCSMLETLPDSFGSLSSLKKLDMDGCVKLQRLPERFGNLSSLQELRTWGCSMLETLPDSFGNLSSLQKLDMFECVKLQRLPERFGNLSSLQELHMWGCSMLETLPDSFGNLSSLQKLVMYECVKLQRLPERFGNLSSLQKLEMRGCSMLETLPESFGNLSSLQEVDIFDCLRMERLPQSFHELSRLQTLIMDNCEMICSLSDNFGGLTSLKLLSICNCKQLNSLPEDIVSLPSLVAVKAYGCTQLEAKAMDSLVEIKSLIFLSIGRSPRLIKRWEEIQQDRPLIGVALRFQDDKYPYEEIMSTMFFNGGSRFLHVDGDGELREVALCSSLDVEVEVGLLLTAPCSLSEEQKHKIMEVASPEFQIIYVYVNVEGEEEAERKERIRKMLLQLPEGSRAWTSPFHKSSLLFAYSLWHFSGSVGVAGRYGETCIVGTRVVVGEEGRRELSLPLQMIYREDDCESRPVDFPTLFNSLEEAWHDFKDGQRNKSNITYKILISTS